MKKDIKKYIYSSYLNEYIDIMDVQALYLFNDFPNSDAGWFSIYVLIGEKGYTYFNGKISTEYSCWDINTLSEYVGKYLYKNNPIIKKISTLHVTPNYNFSEDVFWNDLWTKALKNVEKITKTIYDNQKNIGRNKKEQSIVI
jgi:hypothetical protein